MNGVRLLGNEEESSTGAALKIDAKAWRMMGTLEPHQLEKIVRVQEWLIPRMIGALILTSWAVDRNVDPSDANGNSPND